VHQLSRSQLIPARLPHSLKRNAAWMFASRILRTGMAAVYFALLARSLGVTGYGGFIGVCALASILAPFAGLGSGNLLVRDVACDRTAFAQRWGTCLRATIGSGVILVLLLLVAARIALPQSVPVSVVLAIAVAELLFARLHDLAGMAFQAVEQLAMTASLSFALTVCRCAAAALLFYFTPHATPVTWSWMYLASTILPAGAAVTLVHRRLGCPASATISGFRKLREGLFFSVSLSAQTIYNDIDKTMLARMVSLASAGVYAAAFRIVDAAFSPVNAVLYAAYARFFQCGQRGVRDASRFGFHMLSRAVAYSLVMVAALWISAPYIPAVLGAEFAESVVALRLLSPLLLLRSVHVFAADSLTGAGYQGTRTLLQVVVAVGNVVLNLLLLPRYSWRGACYATLACDGALAVLLWSAVAVLVARESRARRAGAERAVA
jgi:O-antigen/teichoic acid export membrane protein